MDNPALSMLCEAIKPELMRLQPGQTQVVAMPEAWLLGDLEQEFASWCEQRGFIVLRE